MGETPTYGKKKVNISRNAPSNTLSNPKATLPLTLDDNERDEKGKALPVSSPPNAAEAEAVKNVEAAIAAATCSRGSTSEGCEGSGLDSSGGDGDGDGPLDASGRPGWPSSSSSSVRNSGASTTGPGSASSHADEDKTADAGNANGTSASSSSANADANAVFKTVEWYGTIRLLVFVRKGTCLPTV